MNIRIKRNETWARNYAGKIKVYAQNNTWIENDKMLKDFILGKDIAGVGQSYFSSEKTNEIFMFLRKNLELIEEIKELKELNDYSLGKFKRFQEGLINAGGRKCWLAIHAMLCALNPKLLCNVVDENKLDDLYSRLLEKKSEEDNNQNPEADHANLPEIITGNGATLNGQDSLELDLSKLGNEVFWQEKNDDTSWYKKSHAMNTFFDRCYSDLPWATLMSLAGDDRVKNLAKRLKTQKNMILTGAPGTGKTYLAQQIAEKLIKSELKGNNIPEGLIDFVQFHPSYDYSDFVEGLRPIMDGNTVAFRRMDGKFKSFCVEAAKDKTKKPYVFIIDEINRGEISKIFGELFFAIDPGYRNGGISKTYVKTQYHQIIEKKMDDESQAADYPFDKGFYVPDNVYIIGTMNDIDRSVDSMDFAFRRRFAFVEITASESEAMIYNNDINENCKNSLLTRMESLNKAIVDPQKGGLSAEYQIGGAYFLKIKEVDYKYKRLWDEYIKGVLVEYYRGNPDQERIIRMLEDAYNCTSENS